MSADKELLEEAKSLNNNKEYDKVVELLTEKLLEDYKNADLYAEKAQAYWRLGKVDLCDSTVEQSIIINPIHAKANVYLGNVYFSKGKYDDAIQSFEKALSIDSNLAPAYNGLGNIFYLLKDYAKAIECFNQAIKTDSQFAYPYNGLGNVYSSLDNIDLALQAYYKAIELDNSFVLPYNGLASLYRGIKDYPKAIEFYIQAMKTDPGSPSAYRGLGSLYKILKEYDKALEYYHHGLTLDQNSASIYNGIGSVYKALKKYDKAIEYYNKAIQVKSNYKFAFYNLGVVYKNTKKYDLAIDAYNKALEIDPQYTSSYNGLGNVYVKLKDTAKAIKSFSKALEIDSAYEDSYYNRALAYAEIEEYSKALIDLNKYIELTNDETDYYTILALSKIDEIKKQIGSADYKQINELVIKIKSLLLYKGYCVTHYTSFSVSQILVLKGAKFRLSEGTYLNDTSEGREIFKFLPSLILSNNKPSDTVAQPFTAKPFIGSFVSEAKHDDLTLWRMYGKEDKEEARGCALTIERDKFLETLKSFLLPDNIIKSSDRTDDDFNFLGSSDKVDEEFNFYRVAYRKQDKSHFVIPGASDEEETLNKLMNELFDKVDRFLRKAEISKVKDLLELLNDIAYLFKSAEYQYENELRLVIKAIGIPKSISIDNSSGLKVYIDLININPLLKKITFGPKVERADEWASAFYYTLDQQGFHPEIFISHLPFK